MKRVVILTVALAMLAACGADPAGPGEPSTSSTVATTRGSSVPAPTPPSPATDTTTDSEHSLGVSAYLLIDEAGHESRTGPFLVAVNRSIPHTDRTAADAVGQLLDGATAGEASANPAITTQIPEGSALNGIVVEDGTATVDLNAAFRAGDESAAVALRIAQVVFTLTQFPTIESVVFHEDGAPVDVPTSAGQIVDRPVGRADYQDFSAIVSIDQPAYGGPAGNPLRVTGMGAVFEAQFSYALTDSDGVILEQGHAMTTEGNAWASFDFTIDYTVDENQTGALIVWVDSAKDGSRIDIRQYPVILAP